MLVILQIEERARAVNGIGRAQAVRCSLRRKAGFVYENDHQFPTLSHVLEQFTIPTPRTHSSPLKRVKSVRTVQFKTNDTQREANDQDPSI